MRYDNSLLNLHEREKIVRAYSQLVREKMDEGRDAYFINFMFNELPGTGQQRMAIMIQQVERVHSILSNHMLHNPARQKSAHLRPIFIGSHDLPVLKWDCGKDHRLEVANDGLHFNLIALVPPPKDVRQPSWFRYWRWGPQPRLRVSLDQHFREKSRFYVNERLARIHVSPVQRGTMIDYTLKAYKHGRVEEDTLLVLS
jgi:hypothetical protein